MIASIGKIAIITIGTEITDGQIFDRNSWWFSRSLSKWPVQVVSHQSVPDDNALIQNALTWASKIAEVIIVSGGLGPTSDDFTRDVICEWHKVDKQFHPDFWEEVKNKLTTKGVALREGHEQQCWLPAGATPLRNNKGVAPGFFLSFGDEQLLIALPGPPQEIEALWKDHLVELFNHRFNERTNRRHLYTVASLGIPESEVAHMTEILFEKVPKIELGYRLDSPFVETKVWFNHEAQPHELEPLNQLKTQLGAHYVCEDLEVLRKDYLHALARQKNFCFRDEFSQGLFQKRILELAELFKVELKGVFYSPMSSEVKSPSFNDSDYDLTIKISKDTTPLVTLAKAGVANNIEIHWPDRFKPESQIAKLYVFEKIMLEVLKLG